MDENMPRDDVRKHEEFYHAFMKAAGEFGVPFSLALTVFFVALVMAKGIWVALFSAVAVHVLVRFFVKAFFSG